ncbi:hypothetical protein GCM10023187_56280 [Nibrella viscosa]|uniref:Inosine/uridine-preferring nucleoside hydrolase domain-containing protein n=2 Tax=Nibrella viscosa TaxID=1084524 RepID=A0ABP8L3B8_9BACT
MALLLSPMAVLAQNQPLQPRRIWFDTDLMIGLPERAPREVDDGITLMMALQHPDKVDIVGISTVTYVDYGYDIAQKLLTWYSPGRSIPVYKGSDSARQPGEENDATRALANALRKEKLAILAIGPLTNVATVVKNHPELASQIEEVVVCGGRTPGYAFRPGLEKEIVSDYNFERDPESFRVLFNASVPMVLSGFECSVYTFLGKADIDFLNNNHEGDKWVYEQLRPWQQRGKALFGVEGFIPYDATPLGYLTHPEYFKYHRNIPVQINVRKNDATLGQNRPAEKPFLEASYDFKQTKWRATYAYKTLPGFEEIIIESLKRSKARP